MPDNMTPEQRRLTMSRIRKSDTKPEITVRRLVFARGLRVRKYVSSLPGTPDLVFSGARVVVFVDGDFWHGWRFDEWEHKLSSTYWKEKIARYRKRDSEHDRTLRENGWTVIRVWEHEVEQNPEACLVLIETAIRSGWRSARGGDGSRCARKRLRGSSSRWLCSAQARGGEQVCRPEF